MEGQPGDRRGPQGCQGCRRLPGACRDAENRIKNNRTDTPDEPELAFDKIVPVEFRMTDDPTVIGLQKIPNLRAKIKKMEKRYSMPDIEDADFEELPPDDDSKT